MPLITPTTLFVAGSIMSTSSPALFVWMIRTVLAARGRASKNPRCLNDGFSLFKFTIVSSLRRAGSSLATAKAGSQQRQMRRGAARGVSKSDGNRFAKNAQAELVVHTPDGKLRIVALERSRYTVGPGSV